MQRISHKKTAKGFVPAKVAGRHFGYTKDYILMLIKRGKIEGEKSGNKWFVHLPSAQEYFTKAKIERTEKRKKLSEVRKSELRGTANPNLYNSVSFLETHATPGLVKIAALETLVIVLLGLSVGSFGYVSARATPAAISVSDFSFFKNLAVVVYDFFSGGEYSIPREKTVLTMSTQGAGDMRTKTDESSDTQAHAGSQIVIVPEGFLDTQNLDSLRNSFSDTVQVFVDPARPDTGVVIPEFKNASREQYRFLVVPLQSNQLNN